MNKRRVLCLLWAAVVALLAGSLLVSWKRGACFETSLLALLPEAERDPVAGRALDHMAAAGSQRLLFLVRHPDFEVAGRAADALAAELQGQPGIKNVLARLDKDPSGFALDFFRPARYRLLTEAARIKLTEETPRKLADAAFRRMLSPLGPPRLVPIESDPFGLFSQWLLNTASQSALRISGSRLVAQDGGQSWVLVLVELTDDASSVSSEQALRPVLARALDAGKKAGASEILRSGFLFHAAEASASAQREISIIGTGSTLGVILLMLFVFRSLRPMLLVLLTIAVGCVCALATTQLLFVKVHVLTLVFGTSVIGVAVDYGLFFFSGLFDQSQPWEPHLRLKHIFTALLLALFTTLLAYSLLAVLPFPALRQMGVFALSGLSAAWISYVLWLPEMSESLSVTKESRWLLWLIKIDSRWPRFDNSPQLRGVLIALVFLSLAGVHRLKINDDVRQLYASSRDLLREQERAQGILRLPEAGQFILLQATDEESLLQLEESLTPRLDELKNSGRLVDWQGLSQFVPSSARQGRDRALVQDKIFKSGAALDELSKIADAPELAVKCYSFSQETRRHQRVSRSINGWRLASRFLSATSGSDAKGRGKHR